VSAYAVYISERDTIIDGKHPGILRIAGDQGVSNIGITVLDEIRQYIKVGEMLCVQSIFFESLFVIHIILRHIIEPVLEGAESRRGPFKRRRGF